MVDADKKLVNFLFELGMLKKIAHAGIKFAGVRHPDTLAEHTCRSAQIGYMLAIAEKGDPEKVAAMCLIHDIGEIRTGDAHRIAQKYVAMQASEKKAMEDQTRALPAPVRSCIRALWNEFHEQKTRDAQIARDADLLETILQAKEYLDTGYKAAARWLSNGSKFLQTRAAKKLFCEIKKTGFADWWNALNIV